MNEDDSTWIKNDKRHFSQVLGTKCLQTVGIIEFHNNFFTTPYCIQQYFCLIIKSIWKESFKICFWFGLHPIHWALNFPIIFRDAGPKCPVDNEHLDEWQVIIIIII